jgi:hypothetical protein
LKEKNYKFHYCIFFIAAIIEGIITSSKIPMMKIPKIPKQMTNSTSTPTQNSSSFYSLEESSEGCPERQQPKDLSPHREKEEEDSSPTQTGDHCTESVKRPVEGDGPELVELADPLNLNLDKPSHLQVCESIQGKDAQNQQENGDDHSKTQPEFLKEASSCGGKENAVVSEILGETVPVDEENEITVLSEIPGENLLVGEENETTDLAEITGENLLAHEEKKTTVLFEIPGENLLVGEKEKEITVLSEIPGEILQAGEEKETSVLSEILRENFLMGEEKGATVLSEFCGENLPVGEKKETTVVLEIPGKNLLEAGNQSNSSSSVMAVNCDMIAGGKKSTSERSVGSFDEVPLPPIKSEEETALKETILESPKHTVENDSKQPIPAEKVINSNSGVKPPGMPSKKTTAKKISTKLNNELNNVISSFMSKRKENTLGKFNKRYPCYVKEKQEISVYNALQLKKHKDDEEESSKHDSDQQRVIMDDFVNLERDRDLYQVELESGRDLHHLDLESDGDLHHQVNVESCEDLHQVDLESGGDFHQVDLESGGDFHQVDLEISGDLHHQVDLKSGGDLHHQVDLENGGDLHQVEETFTSTDVEINVSSKTDSLSSSTMENDVSSKTDTLIESHPPLVKKTASLQASKGPDYVEEGDFSRVTTQGVQSVQHREEDLPTKQEEESKEPESSQNVLLRRYYNRFCSSARPQKGTSSWNQDVQTGTEDECEPDPDRVVLTTDLDLKITVTNDMPVQSKFSWISKEQHIRDCIHG